MVSHIVLLYCLAAGPVAPGATGAKTAASELDRGQKLLSAGKVDEAMAAFDAAAKLDPKDGRPAYLRGVVLEKKNDLAGAEKAYRQALTLNGKLSPAHNNLGGLLLGKEQLPAAEKEFLAAIDGDPKNAGAYFNLGVLRDRQQKSADAVNAYRKAISLKPNEAAYHMNLSSALRKMGDVEGGLAEAKQAVKLAPSDAMAATNLGLLLSDKQRFDEARAMLTKATQLDPSMAVAWMGLGRVELRRKEPASAIEALSKAAQLAPKDAGIAADLCRAHAVKDLSSKEALAACQKAVKLDGQNALAQYELLKVLVAKGDCGGAKAVLGTFQSLSGVKTEGKTKAAEIAKTCVPGKNAKAGRAK